MLAPPLDVRSLCRVPALFNASLIAGGMLLVGPVSASSAPGEECRFEIGPVGSATLAFVGPLEVADVDGDGDADIIPPMLFGFGPHWLESDGAGGFASRSALPLFATDPVRSARVADLDGDGRPDLVLVVEEDLFGGTTAMVTALRDEAGAYTLTEIPGTQETVVGGSGLAIGDFDGDGVPDVAIGWRTTPGQDAVAILRGVGGGGFELLQVLEVPGLPLDVDVIDLGHDGRPDLVVGSVAFEDLSTPGLTLFTNLDAEPGVPPFAPAKPRLDSMPTMLTHVIDVDGDGIDDIVSVSYSTAPAEGNLLDVRRLAPDGTITALIDRVSLPTGQFFGSFQVATLLDVDGDGDPDLVASASRRLGVTEIRRNDGTGRFSSAEIGPVIPGLGPVFPAAADMDGDGTSELMLARWEDNFEPTVTYRVVDLECPVRPCTTDVDADGSVATGDVLAVLADWGRCGAGEPCPADVNADAAVDFSDLAGVLATWGPCF